MKWSQRWNTLQICPHQDSSSGDSDLWSNVLPTRPWKHPLSALEQFKLNKVLYKILLLLYKVSSYTRIHKTAPLISSKQHIIIFDMRNNTTTESHKGAIIIQTQLMRTNFGRFVLGSSTRQKAYIIWPLLRSSTISSIPPSEKWEMHNTDQGSQKERNI